MPLSECVGLIFGTVPDNMKYYSPLDAFTPPRTGSSSSSRSCGPQRALLCPRFQRWILFHQTNCASDSSVFREPPRILLRCADDIHERLQANAEGIRCTDVEVDAQMCLEWRPRISFDLEEGAKLGNAPVRLDDVGASTLLITGKKNRYFK